MLRRRNYYDYITFSVLYSAQARGQQLLPAIGGLDAAHLTQRSYSPSYLVSRSFLLAVAQAAVAAAATSTTSTQTATNDTVANGIDNCRAVANS